MTTKHEKEMQHAKEARAEERAEERREAKASLVSNAELSVELSTALSALVKIAEEAGQRDHPAVMAGRALLERLKE